MSDAIYSAPGATFYSELDNAPTGLVGSIGVRIIRKSDETTVTARSTEGIVESPAGSGRYKATLEAPDAAGDYTVFWDTGTVSPSTTASDDLIVTYDLPTGGVEPPPGGGRAYAYASYADVRAHLTFVSTWTATTKPNATQVHQHIVNAADELDSALRVADYSVPIPTTATEGMEALRVWSSIGAAAAVAMAMPQGSSGKHGDALTKRWTALLKDIEEGKRQLPVGRETTRSRPRFAGRASSMFALGADDR